MEHTKIINILQRSNLNQTPENIVQFLLDCSSFPDIVLLGQIIQPFLADRVFYICCSWCYTIHNIGLGWTNLDSFSIDDKVIVFWYVSAVNHKGCRQKTHSIFTDIIQIEVDPPSSHPIFRHGKRRGHADIVRGNFWELCKFLDCGRLITLILK